MRVNEWDWKRERVWTRMLICMVMIKVGLLHRRMSFVEPWRWKYNMSSNGGKNKLSDWENNYFSGDRTEVGCG